MKPKSYLLTLIISLIYTSACAQHDWVLKLNKDGIKVYTKTCDSSAVKAIKAECVLTTTMSTLASVLLDINNSKEWIYATKKVELLKQPSATEVIYYSEVGLPWPLSNRDFIVDLLLTQDSITKAVKVMSINKPDYLPHNKDIVRVEQSYSQWTITPMTDGRLSVQYELQVNPGGCIPAWLVNMFATTGPYNTFQNLREQVRKSEYKNTSLAFLRK